MKSFLTHIGNASVNELLLKLIQCEETQEGNGVVEVPFSFFLFFSFLLGDVSARVSMCTLYIVVLSVLSPSRSNYLWKFSG